MQAAPFYISFSLINQTSFSLKVKPAIRWK